MWLLDRTWACIFSVATAVLLALLRGQFAAVGLGSLDGSAVIEAATIYARVTETYEHFVADLSIADFDVRSMKGPERS